MINIRQCELVLAVVLCAISSYLCRPATAQAVVKEVVIRSEWGGYAIPPHRESTIEISRSHAGLYQRSNGIGCTAPKPTPPLAVIRHSGRVDILIDASCLPTLGAKAAAKNEKPDVVRYSARRATTGLRLAARCAGTSAATRAAIARHKVAAPSILGSHGEVAYS